MRILRALVVATSGLLLVNALIHGPGRGLSLIPAEEQGFGLVRILAFGLFVSGAILSNSKPRIAARVLAAGLIARAALELNYSVGRLWFERGGETQPLDFLLLLACYVASFVLPALLAIDCFRSARRGLANAKMPDPR